MNIRTPKLSVSVLLGIVLTLQGCNQLQGSVLKTSEPSSPEPAASRGESAVVSPSIFQQILKQAGQDQQSSSIDKVPVISVEFLNYFGQQNKQSKIYGGDTNEPFVNSYFPKLYRLNAQEYLVEQPCITGYNVLYSYSIYRLKSSLSEFEMSYFPAEAYERDSKGYYLLRNSLNQPIKLSIPEGNLVVLTFDRYRVYTLGNHVKYTSYGVGGRRIYNYSQRILSIFTKNRGMADCGAFARYQLEGGKFKLLEYRYQECCSVQEECRNVNYRSSPDEYPQIYP